MRKRRTTKTPAVSTEASLKASAKKAKETLERLDDEYIKIDTEEKALLKTLDQLMKEEKCLVAALEASRKKPTLQTTRPPATKKAQPVTRKERQNQALARLELALMADVSSSDDESSSQDENEETQLNSKSAISGGEPHTLGVEDLISLSSHDASNGLEEGK